MVAMVFSTILANIHSKAYFVKEESSYGYKLWQNISNEILTKCKGRDMEVKSSLTQVICCQRRNQLWAGVAANSF